jgi:hypothetical protein
MNASLKFLAVGLVGLMAASAGQAARPGNHVRAGNRFVVSGNHNKLVVRTNIRVGTRRAWFGRFSCRRWYPRLGCYIYWNPSYSCWYYCSPGLVEYVPVPSDMSVAPPTDDDDSGE